MAEAEIERKILDEAASNPKVALMMLTLEIDRELRKLLASTGVLSRYNSHIAQSFPIALQILSSVRGVQIPEELKRVIDEFWMLRNNIVHLDLKDSSVPVRALDYGLRILRILRSVPRPSYIVKAANIRVYSDSHCQLERPGVRGVIIETRSPEGQQQHVSIFPTRRQHFVPGMSVAWEWSNDRKAVWDETWYKSLDTGKCTEAWSSSVEFIGRDINEV